LHLSKKSIKIRSLLSLFYCTLIQKPNKN